MGPWHRNPKTFNPTGLDAGQWVHALKDAGFKEVILTAKHHDGFCLWQTAYTDHSVKSSLWEGGKGDVVKDFTDACHAQGVNAGIYLSPWDRNSPLYGDSPAYNKHYVEQLTELLTHYGPITEVWFDGANGEGPNGKKQSYDWDAFFATVIKLAPNAVMFNGSPTDGHGVRFAGNEQGYAQKTNWNHDGIAPNGAGWYPAECDVSIRPGWFYHTSDDGSIKSLSQLIDIYYGSVGRGAVMLLNVPPNRGGRFTDGDIARLTEFHEALGKIFAHDLASGLPVTATNTRGGDARYSPANLTTGKDGAYWATDDAVTTAAATVDLGEPTVFNNVLLQEDIALGQRVAAFTVDAYSDGSWKQVAQGTTIGYKRILWFPRVTASKVRVSVTNSLACPVLTRLALYNSPFDAKVAPVSLLAQKPATASNVHGNETQFGPDKAVNNDDQTRWATDDATKDCWLQVDCGQTVAMGSIGFTEFSPRIKKYRIEYKIGEAAPWQIAAVGTGAGTKSFPPVEARFVRLHILDASDAPTIWEFTAFPPSADQKPSTEPKSLLLFKDATASSVHGNDANYGAEMAIDGDMNTRWATDDGTKECWLQADAGAPITFGSARIREFDPRITKFQIEYKAQAADDWKIAYSGTNAGTDFKTGFPPVTARYVRLHILDASNAPTIYEFGVYPPSAK